MPDRMRMGRPVKRICHACHAERLREDLRRVLEHEARERDEPDGPAGPASSTD